MIDQRSGASRELSGEATRVVHVNSLTAIFEVPTRGGGQSIGVLVTQVIGVRVTLGAQIVEPNKGSGVLVCEGDRCRMDTPLSRALPCHTTKP
jgi:hypothetical protein